jgi:hypothetical protein
LISNFAGSTKRRTTLVIIRVSGLA